jgi:hypothetical protein
MSSDKWCSGLQQFSNLIEDVILQKLSLSGMDYRLSEHPLDQHFSTNIEIYAKVCKVNYPSSDNLISHKNVQIQISGFLISAKQLTFLSNFAM